MKNHSTKIRSWSRQENTANRIGIAFRYRKNKNPGKPSAEIRAYPIWVLLLRVNMFLQIFPTLHAILLYGASSLTLISRCRRNKDAERTAYAKTHPLSALARSANIFVNRDKGVHLRATLWFVAFPMGMLDIFSSLLSRKFSTKRSKNLRKY